MLHMSSILFSVHSGHNWLVGTDQGNGRQVAPLLAPLLNSPFSKVLSSVFSCLHLCGLFFCCRKAWLRIIFAQAVVLSSGFVLLSILALFVLGFALRFALFVLGFALCVLGSSGEGDSLPFLLVADLCSLGRGQPPLHCVSSGQAPGPLSFCSLSFCAAVCSRFSPCPPVVFPCRSHRILRKHRRRGTR